MKTLIKALLKSRIGKIILAELLDIFARKLIDKIKQKNTGSVVSTIAPIAISEILEDAKRELCEVEIHNV